MLVLLHELFILAFPFISFDYFVRCDGLGWAVSPKVFPHEQVEKLEGYVTLSTSVDSIPKFPGNIFVNCAEIETNLSKNTRNKQVKITEIHFSKIPTIQFILVPFLEGVFEIVLSEKVIKSKICQLLIGKLSIMVEVIAHC